MIYLALAVGALLGAVVPTLLWIQTRASSSSRLSSAQTVFKAAASVSALAEAAASRSAKDWLLSTKTQEALEVSRSLLSQMEKLLAVLDRIDVTVGKIADWTVLTKGRGSIRPPLDAATSLPTSPMPTIALGAPTMSGEHESGIARRILGIGHERR